MGVDLELALLVERDIADQRQDLDLFPDEDSLVVLLLPVEVAERGVAQRPDGRQVAAGQPLLSGPEVASGEPPPKRPSYRGGGPSVVERLVHHLPAVGGELVENAHLVDALRAVFFRGRSLELVR